jgi:hypothetical protein
VKIHHQGYIALDGREQTDGSHKGVVAPKMYKVPIPAPDRGMDGRCHARGARIRTYINYDLALRKGVATDPTSWLTLAGGTSLGSGAVEVLLSSDKATSVPASPSYACQARHLGNVARRKEIEHVHV